jgi:hypothetical protein
MTRITKNTLLIALLLMGSAACFAQDRGYFNDREEERRKQEEQSELDCEKARQEAIRDAREGKYVIKTASGLRGEFDVSYEDFFKDYAMKMYRIDFQDQGCIVSLEDDCYTSQMETILERKFGEGIWDRIRSDANAVYPTTENFNFFLNKIENDEVFGEGIVYTPPQFLGGELTINEFVEKALKEIEFGYYYFSLSLVVDKDGKVIEVIDHEKDEDPQSFATIEKILKSTQWTAGDHFGYPVKTKLYRLFSGSDDEIQGYQE